MGTLAFDWFSGNLLTFLGIPGHTFLKQRLVVALAAGVTMALAFPGPGISGFAWIAPGLMLAAGTGTHGRAAFRYGYIAGLTHYLISLHWLLNIPYKWMSMPVGPAAGWLSLSAFLALFPAAWVWLVSRSAIAGGATISRAIPNPASTLSIPADFLRGSWTWRFAWALQGAAAWVALEMIVSRIFGGFPWNLLGASQYQMTPLLQVASFTGVYGVSFVVAWVSLSFTSGAVALLRNPQARHTLLAEVAVPTLCVAILFACGWRTIRHAPEPARTAAIAAVQPSIPQTLIWDSTKDDERFRELLGLSRIALTNKTDILIWPEAAIPKLLRYDEPTMASLSELAREHRVWMIVGADDAEPDRADSKKAQYFNSSFLVTPGGMLANRYKKQSLVIFGEYIPLARWVPVFRWFTPIQGGFVPGDTPVKFEMRDLGLSASVLICFEDVFPNIGRKAARLRPDFLVNLTNDGWFGEGSAQMQQAATSVFRAVENRLPLIRCTNNGLTCWVDVYGRIREVFRDEEGRIYGAGVFRFDLPLPAADSVREPTYYTKHGDVFGWACVVLTLLPLARIPSRLRSGGRP